MILATEKQIINLYPITRINHQKNAYKYLEFLNLKKMDINYNDISKKLNMNASTVYKWFRGQSPIAIRGIEELKSMGLLPLKISNNLAFEQFMITLGFRYADGCIYSQREKNSFTNYACFGQKIDALKFCEDIKKAWGLNLKPHLSGIYYVYLPASLARLMINVGSPYGNKNYQNFKLPKWIFDLNEKLKWKFIDGLFSGDGQSPRLKKSGNSVESLKLSLNAEESIAEQFCLGFMKDIKNLILEMGVEVTEPKIDWNHPLISKEGNTTYSIIIRILTKKQNMIKFLENVPYTYRQNSKRNEVLNALKYKNRIRELEDYLINPQLEPPKISVLLKNNLQKELITKAAYKLSDDKWGKYKILGHYLKLKCKSFNLINAESIFNVYIPKWKKNLKFIPIDCVVELFKLNKIDLKYLQDKIEKLKLTKTHNKYAVPFEVN
ncbi:MAG: hypothetical protein AABW45_01345 [Nanoarchaeota archaeon]